MKNILLLLLGIRELLSLNYYDKYLNRDISSLILRNTEYPFYSSNKLYSSHYLRMYYNQLNNSLFKNVLQSIK